MTSRIAIWAGAGALVVVFWNLYLLATFPAPLGAMGILVHLTCPITLARHHALSLYLVLIVNAATYALIGMVVETMRRQHHARLISH